MATVDRVSGAEEGSRKNRASERSEAQPGKTKGGLKERPPPNS
jgi:hypothetical protein